MVRATFVCLANSKKFSERCIAGVRVDTREWIRPISREKHGELTLAQIRLSNGGDPQIFDLVRASLSDHVPVRNQPENWRIERLPWELLSRPAEKEHAKVLRSVLFRDPVLFGNTSDRVAFRTFDAAPAKESLVLVRPQRPSWEVIRTPTWKKQLRTRFNLATIAYNLAVTDIRYEQKLNSLALGEYSSKQLGILDEGRLYFTVSLGEPLDNGYCFKLVAAVLELPNDWPLLD
jgi:hypothetical protein